jgi:hypothetical protein
MHFVDLNLKPAPSRPGRRPGRLGLGAGSKSTSTSVRNVYVRQKPAPENGAMYREVWVLTMSANV